ncbi:hypothetical protein [Roseateles sp. P5_E1]
MAVLPVGKPLEQEKPVLLVENKLAAGKHRFTLVVINDKGVESEPVSLDVSVSTGLIVPRPPVTPIDRGLIP